MMATYKVLVVTISSTLLLLASTIDAAGNCPSLNNPDYGKFDKCNSGNSCPVGTKAKLTCNSGFRATGDVATCTEAEKPSDEVAKALWNKATGGKAVTSWSPIITPSCVADATHCAPLRLQTLVNVQYSNDKNSCQNGACLQGSQASFTCASGTLCGAAAITCQKSSELASEWSGSTPTCAESGKSCGGLGGSDLISQLSKLFGGGKK